MLTTKDTVRFKTFTPALLHMLRVLLRASDMYFEVPARELVVTSANDSTHTKLSKHYTNEALDVRSKSFRTLREKQAFADKLRADLGDQFTVLLEHEGTDNEHFHLQVRKGRTFAPGDAL